MPSLEREHPQRDRQAARCVSGSTGGVVGPRYPVGNFRNHKALAICTNLGARFENSRSPLNCRIGVRRPKSSNLDEAAPIAADCDLVSMWCALLELRRHTNSSPSYEQELPGRRYSRSSRNRGLKVFVLVASSRFRSVVVI